MCWNTLKSFGNTCENKSLLNIFFLLVLLIYIFLLSLQSCLINSQTLSISFQFISIYKFIIYNTNQSSQCHVSRYYLCSSISKSTHATCLDKRALCSHIAHGSSRIVYRLSIYIICIWRHCYSCRRVIQFVAPEVLLVAGRGTTSNESFVFANERNETKRN